MAGHSLFYLDEYLLDADERLSVSLLEITVLAGESHGNQLGKYIYVHIQVWCNSIGRLACPDQHTLTRSG